MDEFFFGLFVCGAMYLGYVNKKRDQRFKTGFKDNYKPDPKLILTACGSIAIAIVYLFVSSDESPNKSQSNNISAPQVSSAQPRQTPQATAVPAKPLAAPGAVPQSDSLLIEQSKSVVAPPTSASDSNELAEERKPSEQSAAEERYSDKYRMCVQAASSDADLSTCNAEEIERQDNDLNITYQNVMRSLNQDGQSKLRGFQRDWIKMRDAKCSEEASEYSGGTFEGVAHSGCYLRLEVERLIELEKMIIAEPRAK